MPEFEIRSYGEGWLLKTTLPGLDNTTTRIFATFDELMDAAKEIVEWSKQERLAR